jgi:hypothetical protein
LVSTSRVSSCISRRPRKTMIRVAVAGASGKMGSMVCAAVDAAEDMTLVARVGRHDTVDQAVAAGAQVCHVRSIVLLEQHHIAIYAVSRLDNDRVHILDLDQRVCGCLLAWRQSALDCAVQHLITLSNQVVLTSSPSSHIAAHHPMRPCHMRHDCAPPHAAIPHAPHEHVLKNSDRIPLCATHRLWRARF